MIIPENLLYTKDHEWVSFDNDIATIGITDYAQSELGDIIFIEFPNVDDTFNNDDVFGTIEAVKTVADIFSPIKGKVIEINIDLENNPGIVNKDPYGTGWIIKLDSFTEDLSTFLSTKFIDPAIPHIII